MANFLNFTTRKIRFLIAAHLLSLLVIVVSLPNGGIEWNCELDQDYFDLLLLLAKVNAKWVPRACFY